MAMPRPRWASPASKASRWSSAQAACQSVGSWSASAASPSASIAADRGRELLARRVRAPRGRLRQRQQRRRGRLLGRRAELRREVRGGGRARPGASKSSA